MAAMAPSIARLPDDHRASVPQLRLARLLHPHLHHDHAHVDERHGVGGVADGHDEAQRVGGDVGQRVEDQQRRPDDEPDTYDEQDQGRLRDAEDEEAAAALLLHHGEPSNVRPEPSRDAAHHQAVDARRHVPRDAQDHRHHDVHDHRPEELDHGPGLEPVLQVRVVALPHVLEAHLREGLLHALQVLAARAQPLLQQGEVQDVAHHLCKLREGWATANGCERGERKGA
mmetsp:Transcript_47374/g.110020  ORF Transcript_47374/g.110020 Transcript_47374/m.110020 type:complete len:228 (-) Transcript_47374:12-695(-)